MSFMRTLIVVTAVSIPAAAAHAQAPSPDIELLRAEQAAAQRRAIEQDNQLQALDTRLRAENAVAATERAVVRLPAPPYAPATTPSGAQAVQTYPSTPDAALADSDRRVREASRPRR